MKYRIFLAINLPENIKKELENYQIYFPEIPARWVKKANLHLTLIFLGYLAQDGLLEIRNLTKKLVLKYQPFELIIKKINYFPPKKNPPKMIWAEIENSKELEKIQKDLKENIFSNTSLKIIREKKYTPHITLARIRQWEFKKMEPEEMPVVEKELNLKFPVKSIEIMESRLKKGGPDYIILESFSLEK